MTQEEKELLLKDLSARLPYEVICRWESNGFSNEGELTDICHQETNEGFRYWDCYFNCDGEDIPIEIVKPYLRPMSSMTEEERFEWADLFNIELEKLNNIDDEEKAEDLAPNYFAASHSTSIDWLNSHHFDYRGLIEKCLALEAPKDMYETK